MKKRDKKVNFLKEKFSCFPNKIWKRGQITIFIILAIIIVVGVLLYFLWIKPSYVDVSTRGFDFTDCMEEAVEEQMEVLGKQAGFIDPEFYYLYQGNRVGYLCYTSLYYKPCFVQKPFIKQHIEEELLKLARPEIYQCYEDSLDELREQGYDVVSGTPDLDLSLEPGRIFIDLDLPISVSRDTTESYQTFRASIGSSIYDISMVATSILQYETKYGDSDISTMMIFYPSLNIQKIRRGDDTTIYIIEDKNSEIKFQFATRSFAYPPGYGTNQVVSQ